MAMYNYKYVRDQIPEYVTESIEDYEGGCDYDGDMWCAASEYIDHLEAELAKQYAETGKMHNEKLLEWLKTRKETCYVGGPVIPTDDERK